MIFFISGPPASGKSTLSRALLEQFEFGFMLPVDDLREWVVVGRADPVPWTDETTRQFRLAEETACEIARRYHGAGFAVAIDHCCNPGRIDSLVESHFADLEVRKILLLPSMEENLHRSHTRTNKDFDPHLLDDAIRYTNDSFRGEPSADWVVIDNSILTVEQTVELILSARSDQT